MALTGWITGAMGYQMHKDFLANSLQIRQTEVFDFDLFSVDFNTLSANVINSQIKNQFAQVYSGDIRVTNFKTNNTFQFPSDDIRSTQIHATVEIKEAISTLNSQFPELTNTGYYEGLDGNFWSGYGQYLLDFQENYSFATNENGHRVFNHDVSFGIQTGAANTNTQSGRKAFSQTIVSGIFAQDDALSFGLNTMIGQISGLANTTLYRNYYQESYDLFKNVYSFSRKREELPFDSGNSIFNLNYSINMGENGIIDVIEKASTLADITFSAASSNLDKFLSGAYLRCSGKYGQFYNTNIIIQDSQYTGLVPTLALINTPVKTVKSYNVNALEANYEVTFTNNPEFSGDGTITAQTIEFNVGEYNQVEATHTFDYTVNRIIQNSGYLATGLLANTTGSSLTTMYNYYTGNYLNAFASFPNFNLIKYNITYPNIKTKSSARFTYSNSPVYFVTVNGVSFQVLEYTVDNKQPKDIIVEYKIVNPVSNNNQSILNYNYQSEKGEIAIKIRAVLGKNSSQFYPDSMGSFQDLSTLNAGIQPLIYFLQPLYMYAGTIFLAQFNGQNLEALNWFLENSTYSLNSDSILTVNLNYCYTAKKYNYFNNP